MGSVVVGSIKLRSLPVWYHNDNNQQNFKDFAYAGFGLWTKPTMKEYDSSAYLCGYYMDGLEYY